MGAAAIAHVTRQIHTVDGHDVCRVHVNPSGFPVEVDFTHDEDEKKRYIAQRWSS